MRVFLIGYMGSGKSTIGKQLANEFNYQFIDLDTYIEKNEKKIYKGTGIGLAICLQLVNAMKGEIWVESEQGKGTKFHFTIPI